MKKTGKFGQDPTEVRDNRTDVVRIPTDHAFLVDPMKFAQEDVYGKARAGTPGGRQL